MRCKVLNHRCVNRFFATFLLLLFAVTFLSPQVARSAPEVPEDAEVLDIKDALKLVEIMENRWDEVVGYTVITYKQERHGGELMDRERIYTKFKRPFSVYMEWIEDDPPEHKNPNLGQEMIYEKGWNDNTIYAHLGERSYFPGWVTNASSWVIDYTALEPNGRVATMYQRHTIDEIPFGETIKRIATAVRGGIENPEDDVTFVNRGYRNVFGSPSGCIEGYLPGDKRDIYYDDRVLVCVDLQSKMPSQIIVRNGEGQVLENYRMEDINLNPGLEQEEFRPDYPEYNFDEGE